MPDLHHEYGPSSLGYREVCPGWTRDTFADTTKADEGTRLHKAIETGDIAGLTEDQVALVVKCRTLLAELSSGAEKVDLEVMLQILGGLTFGTADVKIRRRTKQGKLRVVVTDWKTGQEGVTPAEDNRQGHAYLLGAAATDPDAEELEIVFALPRRDEVDRHVFTRKDLPKLELAVRTIIARCEEYKRTGDESMLNPTTTVCGRCGNLGKCPKAKTYALTTAKQYAPLELVEETHGSQITDVAQMAKFVTALKVLEKMVESGKHHATQFALDHGGLRDHTGKLVYEIAEKASPRKISNLGAAVEVFRETGLSDAELLSCAELSLTRALKLASDRAAKGQKGKVLAAVETRLSDAGAITQGEPSRFLRKVKE